MPDNRAMTTRLNKHIADTGFCSRREADRLIAARRVTVNGHPAGTGAVVGDEDQCWSTASHCARAWPASPAHAAMSTSR